MIGMNTAIWALGLLAGPLIGSILYSLMGFRNAFVFYGCVQVLLSVAIRIGLSGKTPYQDDVKQEESERQSLVEAIEPKRRTEPNTLNVDKNESLLFRNSELQRASFMSVGYPGRTIEQIDEDNNEPQGATNQP